MVDSGTSSRSAESAVQSISAEVRCEETDISHMGLHAWRVVISWHTMHSMHSRQALCSRSPADILHPGHSNELLFAQTLVQGRNFKLPIRPPTQVTSLLHPSQIVELSSSVTSSEELHVLCAAACVVLRLTNVYHTSRGARGAEITHGMLACRRHLTASLS